jgi:Tol biopolymer transport system component
MDLWRADRDGGNARLLFQSEGYDAEATVCPRDGRIVFTSTCSGDPELYVVARHGSNLRQLTDTPGYDGGAFFSADCLVDRRGPHGCRWQHPTQARERQ